MKRSRTSQSPVNNKKVIQNIKNDENIVREFSAIENRETIQETASFCEESYSNNKEQLTTSREQKEECHDYQNISNSNEQRNTTNNNNINNSNIDDCFLIHINNVAVCVPCNEPYIHCQTMFGVYNAITHYCPILLWDCTCYLPSSLYAQRSQLEQQLEQLLQTRKDFIRVEDALRHKRRREQLRARTKQKQNIVSHEEQQQEEEKQQELEEKQYEEELLEEEEQSVLNTEKQSNNVLDKMSLAGNDTTTHQSIKECTRDIREIRKALSRLDEEFKKAMNSNQGNNNNNNNNNISSASTNSNVSITANTNSVISNWKYYALPPLPILLLPSAKTGLTRVCANHVYETVTFVGERLCRVEGWRHVHNPLQVAYEPNKREQEQQEWLCEQQRHCTTTNVNLQTAKVKSAQETQVAEQIQKEKQKAWAEREYASLRQFFTQHPHKTIEDYFALSPSEMAALQN